MRLALIVLMVAALGSGAGHSSAGLVVPSQRALVVGVAEDAVRSSDAGTAREQTALVSRAGFGAVRVTSIWAPGATEPGAAELRILRNVAEAAERSGVRVYVTVMNAGSRTTPLTVTDQQQFAEYAAALVRELPSIRDVIVGNEPNLNRFWMPQFGADGTDAAAEAYEALLATTYDEVESVDPGVRIWGGALAPRGVDRPNTGRDTHSPTAFIADLAAAFRASGRTGRLMDGFAFHPYADTSSQAPDVPHPLSTSIGVADYGKLVQLLGQGFDGTAQPGTTLPILYDEFGVETVIPLAKTTLYTGTEPATTKPVEESTQAVYYARALQLAFCQPTVTGVLLFHAVDEQALASWQSGVYYADGTPKSSLAAVAEAVARTRAGSIARCGGVSLTVRPLTLRFPTASETARGVRKVRLRCDLDCAFDARLVRLPSGRRVAGRRGTGRARTPIVVDLGTTRLAAGMYRYTLSLRHPVNPAPTPTTRAGLAFRLP
jgi:hypothetical protein